MLPPPVRPGRQKTGITLKPAPTAATVYAVGAQPFRESEMYQELVGQARERRRIALHIVRMPQLNIFWDSQPPKAPRHTVIAQLSDLRIRMGRTRAPLVSAFG